MAELLIEAETGKTRLDEVRAEIDATLRKHLSGGLVDCRWDGDVLRITGPGARGTMVFVAGKLRVQGSLSLPASLFQPVIEQKIRAAFEEAFGDGSAAAGVGTAGP